MEENARIKPAVIIFLGTVALALFLVWSEILTTPIHSGMYFLDVGQGDSELAILPGGAAILTDAGPDGSIISALDKAVPRLEYIDIAVITHPQLDHFNGFNFVLEKYPVGAVVLNGRADSPGVEEWKTLIQKIKSKNIPLITLGAGSRIKYAHSIVEFLSPGPGLIDSGELNDTGLVEYVKMPEFRTLLLADIGESAENAIFKNPLPADVLKVAHHGSKYSTGEKILAAVRPRAAVIEVGRNSYGHPAARTLDSLALRKIPVFRTDRNGSIFVRAENGKIVFAAEK